MNRSDLAGKVQTVLGAIEPETLGITLTHEHLLLDASGTFVPPETASEIGLSRQPVSMENLWWIQYHWNGNLDNQGLTDEETAIQEVFRFKMAGGKTIVDVTNIGIKRDPKGLARIARATGLNMIMGAGYYVDGCHPADMSRKSEDEIIEEIVRDVVEGVGDTGIKAGIIGEIGCSWPLTDNERKSLRAAVRAHHLTGAPLLIHPGRPPQAHLEIMEIIREVGGDPHRTVMSHIDCSPFDLEILSKLAETGCYLNYDNFGLETALHPKATIDMPNDGRRIDDILYLVKQGRLEQVLVSQDICLKMSLTKYGGYGYAHILENVVPMMRRKGLSLEQVNTILVENPKRALTFA